MTTLDAHDLVVIVQPLGLILDPTDVRITVDERWSPYCQADVTCVLPEAGVRALLDLRETPLRLDIRARQDFGQAWPLARLTEVIGGSVAALTALLDGGPLGSLTNRYYVPWNEAAVRESHSRSFDLWVKQRELDDTRGLLYAVATSGELLLLNDALATAEPWSPGTTSLRSICALVLARYGAVLDAESLDAIVEEEEATAWTPGRTAWAYLDPMLEAASLRLWCDEIGVWRISARESTAPGAVTLTPTDTMTRHLDRMSLDPETWVDAVIIEYRWTDAFDLAQVAYDVEGVQPSRAARHIVRESTVYPGPGAAAGILNRAQGRGRVLDVGAVSDYRLTPGMPATITPPETDAQTGFVSAVTWSWPAAEMTVTTRGLVDTPPTSWLYAPAGVSWLDIPPGLSWLDYTPIGA